MFALAVSLSGCESKTSSPATTGSNLKVPPLDETTSSTTSTAPVSGDTTSGAGGDNSLTSQIDVAGIDKIFNQNFTLAQDDANKNVGEGSKFCFAKVSFLGGVASTKGEMSFFFQNDQRIGDYYWLVSFDTTSNNQKKRYLAAKRDWGELTCTTLAGPPSFASAYDNFVSSGKISSTAAFSSAKTEMIMAGDVWKIEQYDTSGEQILSATQASPPATTGT